MGQTITKLSEKYCNSQIQSSKQESKGMLCDMAMDDSDVTASDFLGDGDILDSSRTPPNVLKLKCDPRSPSDFDRTPLKIPLCED